MKNFIYRFFLSILWLLGCESNITNPLDLSNKNLLRKQYPVDNPNYCIKYFYNAKDKIKIRENYGYNGELEAMIDYEYDDRSNIIRKNTFHTYYGGPEYSYCTYQYNEQNLLEKVLAYLRMTDKTYDFRSTTLCKYNSDNRIVEFSIYNTEVIKTKYTEIFYDSLGNVSQTKRYQGGELYFIDTYQFDNMNNPLNFLNAEISVYNLSPNNILIHSYTNLNHSDDIFLREYIYEYNENNFPVSCMADSYKVIFEYY